MNDYTNCWKKYATFSGRARRKEYWIFTLINGIIFIVLAMLEGSFQQSMDGQTEYGLLTGLFCLAVFIPSLAVTIRRLHDINRSGWWILMVFVPVIGGLVLLIFTLMDSTRGDNRFGLSPKYPTILD